MFDPDHPETAITAMEQGFRLAEEGNIGPANQKLALEKWSAEQCGAKYVEFFERLRAGSRVRVEGSGLRVESVDE